MMLTSANCIVSVGIFSENKYIFSEITLLNYIITLLNYMLLYIIAKLHVSSTLLQSFKSKGIMYTPPSVEQT